MICGWHKKAALPSSEQLLLSWTTRLSATIGSFFLQICYRFPFSSSDYLKENWSIFIFWVFIPVSYTVSFYGYRIRASEKLGLEVGWLTFLSLSQKGGPTSNPNFSESLGTLSFSTFKSNILSSWIWKKLSKSRIIEGICPYSHEIAQTTQTVRLWCSQMWLIEQLYTKLAFSWPNFPKGP